ncbi:hypothetical protein R5H30_04765 [Sulfitobacter sp. D35]|uniref:hypothetical protein n=1 Tax=Sulfitobacter sp. D35 TaxID=3083252 RepID=UPI00296F1B24|nr:hypothetical protein [Sulfitobacter sp. D35]MDW4497283.1 hypothetical protein [Sulfitobacter sp. D35]
MQTQTETRTLTKILPRPDCLGCVDCKGYCRDILEMTFVPDQVLHRSDTHT